MVHQEHFGYLETLKVAWIGDGNNIANSLLMGCPKMGVNLSIATPAVSRSFDVDLMSYSNIHQPFIKTGCWKKQTVHKMCFYAHIVTRTIRQFGILKMGGQLGDKKCCI